MTDPLRLRLVLQSYEGSFTMRSLSRRRPRTRSPNGRPTRCGLAIRSRPPLANRGGPRS